MSIHPADYQINPTAGTKTVSSRKRSRLPKKTSRLATASSFLSGPPKSPVSGVLPRFDRVVPRRARFSGKWVKQNVRVKTPWEMTATFGIKLPRKVVSGLKSVDRFDKRIVDVGVSKALKTRVRVKRVGRKKRGKR